METKVLENEKCAKDKDVKQFLQHRQRRYKPRVIVSASNYTPTIFRRHIKHNHINDTFMCRFNRNVNKQTKLKHGMSIVLFRPLINQVFGYKSNKAKHFVDFSLVGINCKHIHSEDLYDHYQYANLSYDHGKYANNYSVGLVCVPKQNINNNILEFENAFSLISCITIHSYLT